VRRGESNHRIKNNLQMILSMLEYKAIKSGKRSDELEKITGNIKAISSLHKHLSLDIHNPYVDLIVYLKEIVSLYKEFSPQNFEVKSDLKVIEIQSERIVYFGLLFNEMLSNTIEHSLDKETKMLVSLNKEKEGFSFSYRDGAEWENLKETGIGSSLIPELVERVEGENYSLDNKQGLYYFEFNT
jgi:two-component sensor histidine kinase